VASHTNKTRSAQAAGQVHAAVGIVTTTTLYVADRVPVFAWADGCPTMHGQVILVLTKARRSVTAARTA
jgi:hypothetical protein